MKNIVSSAKIELGHYLFQNPLPYLLTPKQAAMMNKGKKFFEHSLFCSEEYRATANFHLYRFNPGGKKKALVVHGWMSKAEHMSLHIENLIQNDYQVIALDLPSHGKNLGVKNRWQDSVNAIHHTQKLYGPFDLALGHSYGGSMLLISQSVKFICKEINDQLNVPKMILLASPTRIKTAINLFAEKLKLTGLAYSEYYQKIQNLVETDIDLLDGLFLGREYPTKTHYLCLHSPNDGIVPYDDSLYLRQLGEQVRLLTMPPVGHIGLLWDKIVLNKVRNFI